MRSLIKIALGFLLLVSAAAAMGKYPSILCQMGDMVGNATGCDNHVSQDIRLKTDDNSMCGGMLTQLSTIVSND